MNTNNLTGRCLCHGISSSISTTTQCIDWLSFINLGDLVAVCLETIKETFFFFFNVFKKF